MSTYHTELFISYIVNGFQKNNSEALNDFFKMKIQLKLLFYKKMKDPSYPCVVFQCRNDKTCNIYILPRLQMWN